MQLAVLLKSHFLWFLKENFDVFYFNLKVIQVFSFLSHFFFFFFACGIGSSSYSDLAQHSSLVFAHFALTLFPATLALLRLYLLLGYRSRSVPPNPGLHVCIF